MGNVNIPNELKEEIKKLKNSEMFGIKSVDEFVRESVRKNLQYYQENAVIKKSFECIYKEKGENKKWLKKE